MYFKYTLKRFMVDHDDGAISLRINFIVIVFSHLQKLGLGKLINQNDHF